MARPEKKDVDYFPFYVKHGKTLAILEGKYKAIGSGFFVNFLKILAKTPDHHICLEDEASRIYFFSQILVEESQGIDMLNLMSITGKIDKTLWEQRQVIVSKDFLNSIEHAYAKRQILLITIPQIYSLYGLEYKGDDEDKNENEAIKKTLLSDTVMHTQISDMFTISQSDVVNELSTFLENYGDNDMGTTKKIKAAFIKHLQRYKKFTKYEQPTEAEV